MNTPGTRTLEEILRIRDESIRSLDRSLSGKTRLEMIAILTSFLSIDELEKLTKFQERKG